MSTMENNTDKYLYKSVITTQIVLQAVVPFFKTKSWMYSKGGGDSKLGRFITLVQVPNGG